MSIGVFFEKLVGLNPVYPSKDEWQCGIECFKGKGWMTVLGQFGKTRHWKYTNCVTGEEFSTAGGSSYHANIIELRTTIMQRYRYDGVRCDKPWFDADAAHAAFAIAHSAPVKTHGAALIWQRHVDLDSLYMRPGVVRGVEAMFPNDARQQERFRSRSRPGSPDVSLPHVGDLLDILEANPARFCTGSVIVSGHYVEAMSVSLPFDNEMTPGYGFRHSSALEFTRKVDATAVIVSKSGTVSFVKNGTLYQVPMNLMDDETVFVAFVCAGGLWAGSEGWRAIPVASDDAAPPEGDAVVKQYLMDVNAAIHFPKFARQEIDAESFVLLSEKDLEALDIPMGPRRKISHKISQLRESE
eukprot:GEMP01062748.1.p1 GENE.GEMP01062748.1~~GEMP01062748.1.p1  ORF type:complete len:371 (+),score=74.84 GEMP01062748.1:49-1113(+)